MTVSRLLPRIALPFGIIGGLHAMSATALAQATEQGRLRMPHRHRAASAAARQTEPAVLAMQEPHASTAVPPTPLGTIMPVAAEPTSEGELAEVVVNAELKGPMEQRLAQTRATYPGSVASVSPEELALQKTSNLGDVLARITSEVKDYRKQEIGIVKPMFYARAALGNAAPPERPSLELDLLPVPAERGMFRVFFAGKPLAGAKVFVYAPNLWMRELVSDEQGQVTAPAPWPGRYVLDVTHKDGKPGEYRAPRRATT